MENKQCNVVFYGEILPGKNSNEVKKKLEALFKTDEKKIERLFSKTRFVIKKNIDCQAAQKYVDAFEKAGAICNVEEIQPPASQERQQLLPTELKKAPLNRRERDFRPLLKYLSVWVIAIFLIIIFAKNSVLLRNLFLFYSDGIYEVTKASDSLPTQEEPAETIDIYEISELRKMLSDERFEELNTVLEEYQSAFENDQTDEYKLYDAYNAFYMTVSAYEDFFKKWIDTTPDKYQPYLATAQYYYAKGWESRGYKFKKDTPEEQFEEMRLFFDEAEDNLRLALNINPNLMIAYKILMGIYNATENYDGENEIIKKTLELFPYSFLIKSTCSWAKEPRWGGSYMYMEEMAKNAEIYSDKNPKLSVLYGFIYYDQGKILKQKEKYEKALELFDKALLFGDHWVFYNERAKIYHYHLKEYDRALDDINRSIELRPVMLKNYLVRSRIYFAQSNYIHAIDDLHTAEIIKPGDSGIQKWKEWASKNLLNRGHSVFKTDIQEAIEYYDLSFEFDDNNFETYYWRGVAFNRLNRYESASMNFRTAIEINPHHFESYRMIDSILARDRQWDTIISYWNTFIALEPAHAGAYFERAGTHYHNKDFENAMYDLKKACELGNKNACKRYNMNKQ